MSSGFITENDDASPSFDKKQIMKKSRKPQSTTKKKQPQATAATPKRKATLSRRAVLSNAKFYGVVLFILLGGAYWGVSSFQSSLAEKDLSVLGQGTPVIVQVHDPACQPCIDLQRETRAALSDFDNTDLGYRVADITSEDGLAFATEHAASFATLLFFDGAGEVTRRIRGATDRNTLRAAFLSHVAEN